MATFSPSPNKKNIVFPVAAGVCSKSVERDSVGVFRPRRKRHVDEQNELLYEGYRLAHGRMLHRAPHRQLALYSTHRTPLPAPFFSPRKIDAKESSIQTGRTGKEREL